MRVACFFCDGVQEIQGQPGRFILIGVGIGGFTKVEPSWNTWLVILVMPDFGDPPADMKLVLVQPDGATTQHGEIKVNAGGHEWPLWFPMQLTVAWETGRFQFEVRQGADTLCTLPFRVEPPAP